MAKDIAFHKEYELQLAESRNSADMSPFRYVLVLTGACNLHCSFCFQHKRSVKQPLNTQEWLAILSQLPANARVTLTGGEPLLFHGFSEIFSYAASHYDCNIISNGLLLNKETIKLLLAQNRFRVLSISIDDIGNGIRGVKPEQWQHLVAMLQFFQLRKAALESSCILDIKTMVLEENASDLFAIHKFVAEELKADTHVFQFQKGSPLQHSDQEYDFEEIFARSQALVLKNFTEVKKQLKLVQAYAENHRTSVYLHPKVTELDRSYDSQRLDLLNRKLHDSDLYQTCPYPGTSVHINSDGKVFPCLSVCVGNVREKSLSEIARGTKFALFREEIGRVGTVPGCNRCGWLKIAG